MTRSLFSPHWYRVADRRPRLRAGVQVTRQPARGTAWHVLSDPVSGRRCRLNPQAWSLAGRLDGERSVDAIWSHLVDEFGAEAPTQDEVVQILGQLAAEGLVTMDALPDFASRAWRRGRRQARRRNERINPFALRMPLGSPGSALDRLAAPGRWIFSPAGLVAWAILLCVALAVLVTEGPALFAEARARLDSPWMLLLAWLLYLPIKFAHELAHGLAARRYGVDVPEAGVTLLVLVPSPYVDVSESAALARRGERLVVAGAGIASDLAIAAAALIVWSEAAPGLVRDLSLCAVLVAGVGTLLFNANPWLRFDGYHLLCDALDLPQLATRSQRLWQQRLHGWAGIDRPDEPSADQSAGERAWLETHAPLAFGVRAAIGAGISVWAGGYSAVLGLLIGAWVLAALVLWPAFRMLRDLLVASRGTPAQTRTRWRTATAVLLPLMLAFAVPLPHHSTAQGVVRPPEPAFVRPEVDGLVVTVHAADGTAVFPGTLLITLDDPVLRARLARAQARVLELEAERYGQIGRDALRASDGEEALDRARAEVSELESRLSRLEIRAATAGRLAIAVPDDLPGAWLRRGVPVAYVLDDTPARVRAAVPESEAGLLREAVHEVRVRLAEHPGVSHEGVLEGDMPAAIPELPGEALGARGRGGLETEPSDSRGLRTREPFVHVDVRLPVAAQRVGGLAWVRFDHGWSALAPRLWRSARQIFLRRFDASA